MRKRTQEIIEFSDWMFPAIIASGWLSPVIFLVNILIEIVRWFI